MAMQLRVNGKSVLVEAEPDTPLLWVLRDTLGLVGTKFGCGIGQCGACTVHLNGAAVRSCLLPIASLVDAEITAIEGLQGPDGKLHPLQQAWIEQDVAQCGYCQPGQIMSAAAFLQNNAEPTETDVSRAMSGNLCRCGTYLRVNRAILSVVERGRNV